MSFLQQLWQPFATLFHYVFYLPIFNVLMLLYEGVHAVAPGLPAFAIAIFLLTILVRLCLFPLTRKQLQSSRAMQALQPQLQELQRRYKNNPQELMAAQRALYQEHGVSMYGGCLPLLIQMPFLYGLYFSLYTALIPPKGPHGQTLPPAQAHAALLHNINHDIYPFLPPIHTVPSTHFLWTDLAGKDPWYVLPILAAVLTFIQLRMAQPVKRPTPPGQRADPNTQAMGSMQYFMPVITLFMAANFPSGLAFYWTISTGFSAVQQYLLTGFGSLFVGIPGMEHLVPEPQPLPGPPAPRTSTTSGLVDAGSPPAARPSMLNALASMLRQLTEPPKSEEGANGTGQATTSPGAQKPPAKAPGKAETGRVPGPAAPASSVPAGDQQPGATNGTTPPAARRPRPPRTGPTLVKPPSAGTPVAPAPAPPENDTAASQPAEAATSAAPAEPAAPAASGLSAQPAASSNGVANGAKPGASANSTTDGAGFDVPANGTRPSAPAKTPAPPRPASSGSAAKTSSSKQSQRPASSGSRGSGGGAPGRRRPSGKSKGGR